MACAKTPRRTPARSSSTPGFERKALNVDRERRTYAKGGHARADPRRGGGCGGSGGVSGGDPPGVSRVFETLTVRAEGAVFFAETPAPPMNLLGPELVRDLVSL